MPPILDPKVLVGTASADDAGVYLLDDGHAIVSTLDFFTPIVDDPYDFGRIAAANALSDIYAMGATPLFALAIAAFPENMAPEIIGAILRGGVDSAAAAGIAIIGGHTIKDEEPKYGLAVTGIVHPERILRNNSGRAGDALILTKAIGTGILTTARRSDAIAPDALAPAVASMATLNRSAAECALRFDVSAMTDITGFGLLGHLHEMLGGELGARIDAQAVPLLPGALDLARENIVPGGTRTNLDAAIGDGTRFGDTVPAALQLVLADAQTSGGLLIAVAEREADALLAALHESALPAAARIGSLVRGAGIDVA
uniref:Selenide, water dikinase (Selenophosphate synthetase) (Selenium donor protein) n=1 Tax=mine drainage metagenome TaxID=410659 RepID=E6PEE5_9ZZZZ